MHSLSIFGTSSDAGKSTLAFALTYLLHKEGIRVAPFKAQNVSNNARVCDRGGEIAEPQHFAAEAIGLETRSDFNPVLLKSGRESKATLIVNGAAIKEQDVREYYADLDRLKPVVKSAFERLKEEFELVVAEGAGSPVELNLMDKDLSNIYVAQTFRTKIVLVADIEKGGVFASVWGVYNLLPQELQKNVIGVVINKFRGDMSLFDEGRRIIEKRFGLKVLGVVPYRSFNLGFEDSQSLLNYSQAKKAPKIRVAVIAYPHMSNFTDFEPLIADKEVYVEFIRGSARLQGYDMVVLPGSKRTISDLQWMKSEGLFDEVLGFKKSIVAICGGYQMAFEAIEDPEGIEDHKGSKEAGLGIVEGSILFEGEKVVTKGVYELFGEKVSGYEIHNGHSKKLSTQKKHFYGTFVHGLFESDAIRQKLFGRIDPTYRGYDFKRYKSEEIEAFARHIQSHLDWTYLKEALSE